MATERKQARLREVARRLRALRKAHGVLLAAHRRKTVARFDEILRVLDGKPARGRPRPVTPGLRGMRMMLEALDALDLVPRKGRAKDLVRLNRTLRTLTEILPPQP